MDYRILDWFEAKLLREKEGSRLLKLVDYNLSTVYQLPDSSYLVMALNTFAKCLITPNKSTLDKWMEQNFYPTGEEVNKFYFDNKDKIDNLMENKEMLKSELLSYIYKEEKKSITSEEIDRIHALLKKRKKFNQYSLHFKVLLGDYLIDHNPKLSCRWGILMEK